MTLRLSGTEKQRDDALEALVLQQEIAEDLERERKRNKKDLSKIQLRVEAMGQQREEAHRVVLHLRSLIQGQSHHMEHMLRSIGSSTEISDFLGFDEIAEEAEDTAPESNKQQEEHMDSNIEKNMLGMDKTQKRLARLSITDVADRYLRDKTDAIADIVRNISEQCAAAVEGLQLAQQAVDDGSSDNETTMPTEQEENEQTTDVKEQAKATTEKENSNNTRNTKTRPLSLTNRSVATTDTTTDNETVTSTNSKAPTRESYRYSSIPPTPDLIHNRSSTSMSNFSNSTQPLSTMYTERTSTQYAPSEVGGPMRIVEGDGDHRGDEAIDDGSETATATISKQASEDLIRPTTAERRRVLS